MIERLRFFAAWRIWNIPDHFGFGMGSNMFLDLHPDGLQIESHLLQNVHCYALAKFDQAEQKVLCTHIIVVEAVRFFARERQHLLRTWCKVVHHCNSAAGLAALAPDILSIRWFRKTFQLLADRVSPQVVPFVSG